MLEKLFKLSKNGTTVKTEFIAGLTTFLAMAYILALAPSFVGGIDGVDPAAIFTGVAISATIATLCMAFFANYPVALASGVSLTAFFSYTVCGSMGCPYSVAITAVLFEGIIFLLLSFCNFREALVNQIPKNLKLGISAGVGLFITAIAMSNAGIIADSPSNLITVGEFNNPTMVLSILGLIIIGILRHFKVPGDVLLGILATWGLGILAELCGWYVPNPDAGIASLIPDFSKGITLSMPHFASFDFSYILANPSTFLVIMFTFLFSDLFDTVGTLIGVSEKAGLLDEDGNLPNAKGALMADAVGTCVGSFLGVPTVTSYVESTTGASAGGKTGLASVVTALLFLAALVLSPLFLAIPSFATAPAMMFVGLLMLGSVKEMDFETDPADAIGGFIAVIFMPMTLSISTGIMFAMLSWCITKICTGKICDIKPVMWISTALFALYFTLSFIGMI